MFILELTVEAIWNVLVENTVMASWNSLASEDSTFTREVISYLTETPIKWAWDDFLDHAICPWYHPWAALKQVLIPIIRLLWELLGKSPVFWFFFITFMLRRIHCDYRRYAVAVGGGETPSIRGWWRTKGLSFYLRVPRVKAPVPADDAPVPVEKAPAPGQSVPAPAVDVPTSAENA